MIGSFSWITKDFEKLLASFWVQESRQTSSIMMIAKEKSDRRNSKLKITSLKYFLPNFITYLISIVL